MHGGKSFVLKISPNGEVIARSSRRRYVGICLVFGNGLGDGAIMAYRWRLFNLSYVESGKQSPWGVGVGGIG